jgi:hypothetical protein
MISICDMMKMFEGEAKHNPFGFYIDFNESMLIKLYHIYQQKLNIWSLKSLLVLDKSFDFLHKKIF